MTTAWKSDIGKDDRVDTTQSATQKAYKRIRRQIIEGTIPPGEKLKVDSLKQQLDTGAAPVREALSLLTSDQLVERNDQRGFRSTPVSISHFNEILMLRCKLEEIALRQSIENADTHWEENLVLTHYHLSKARRRDATDWESKHRDFHYALLANCGSPVLLGFCQQLYDLNIRYRHLAGESAKYKSRTISAEHKHIMNAALAKNLDLSSELLKQHYTTTGEYLADQLEHSGKLEFTS